MKNLKTKNSILAIIFFASSLTFMSCSKKDDPIPAPVVYQFPVENFLNGFLTTTGFDQQTTNQISTSGYYNMGVAFKPKVNGTINSITIKLPSSDGGVVVRIWKVSTQALLKTIPVVVATNNLEVTTSIDKLPLLKDEEYVITMKVNSWFDRKKTNNSSVNFPVEVNNIKITGTTNTIINTYPGINNNISGNIYFGDISFNFQQTE
jgi:hypothetical protein